MKSTPRTREAQRAKRESDEIRNDIEVPSDTEVLPKASVVLNGEKRTAKVRKTIEGRYYVTLHGESTRSKILNQTFSPETTIRRLQIEKFFGQDLWIWFQAEDSIWRTYYTWFVRENKLYYGAYNKKSGEVVLSENMNPESALAGKLSRMAKK